MSIVRLLSVLILMGLFAPCVVAQGVAEMAQDTRQSVVNRAEDAAEQARQMKRDVEEVAAGNLVAWGLIGLAIGGLVSSVVTMGNGRRIAHIVAGVAGGVIAGMITHITQLDMGWGQVTLRYEDMLMAAAGAGLLAIIAQIMRVRSARAKAQKAMEKAK